MAGDLRIIERAVIETAAQAAEATLEPGRAIHQYGRLKIFAVPEGREAVMA